MKDFFLTKDYFYWYLYLSRVTVITGALKWSKSKGTEQPKQEVFIRSKNGARARKFVVLYRFDFMFKIEKNNLKY